VLSGGSKTQVSEKSACLQGESPTETRPGVSLYKKGNLVLSPPVRGGQLLEKKENKKIAQCVFPMKGAHGDGRRGSQRGDYLVPLNRRVQVSRENASGPAGESMTASGKPQTEENNCNERTRTFIRRVKCRSSISVQMVTSGELARRMCDGGKGKKASEDLVFRRRVQWVREGTTLSWLKRQRFVAEEGETGGE